MIEFKDIRKSFGDKVVLDGVSHVLESGKTNLIIGTSGSGKTVLQKCLVGLLRPDSGSISYDGRDFLNMDVKDKKQLRQDIGMLFQGSALFDSMTVEQNIRFPLDMFTNDSSEQKMKRVNEVLERVELVGSNKKFPSEISGGMKKRVGIARAIVLKPKYLFCDEPNSGLDPKTSMVIDQLIHEITRENDMVTVINTHDMNSVMEIGDNILYMVKGQKEWVGNSEDIIFSDNVQLNEFIFASHFLQDAKNLRMLDAQGKVDAEALREEMDITNKDKNDGDTAEPNS